MKEFKIAKTKTHTVNGIEIEDTKFMYDGIKGVYAKITTNSTNVAYIIYDGHECMWGISKGKTALFGKRFELPKYEDFVSSMSRKFNIDIPTVTFDFDKLVVYYTNVPTESDSDGNTRDISEFMYKGISGRCTEIRSEIKKESIIEYNGLRTVITRHYDFVVIDTNVGDKYQLPEYSDFVRQIKDTFDIELPTIDKSTVSKTVNHIDIIDDEIPIPSSKHKQEENKSNADKITILDKTEDRYRYKEYDCIDSVTKFMYNGKKGKYTKNVFGSIVTHTIEHNGFKTLIKSNRNEPEGDRYELPEHSDFVNQIKDAFGVELPIIKREHNKITILKKTETKERSVYITTYTFEFNGKPGTCTHRNGECINATRIEYDGRDKEWGYYFGDWDFTSYTFTQPEYAEFRKAVEKAFGVSFPYERHID